MSGFSSIRTRPERVLTNRDASCCSLTVSSGWVASFPCRLLTRSWAFLRVSEEISPSSSSLRAFSAISSKIFFSSMNRSPSSAAGHFFASFTWERTMVTASVALRNGISAMIFASIGAVAIFSDELEIRGSAS